MQEVKLFLPSPALRHIIRNYAFFSHTIEGWKEGYVWQLPALKDHALQLFPDEIPTLFDPGNGKQFSVSRCNVFGVVDRSFLDSRMPRSCTRLQVTFEPTGFFELTGIPSYDFSNCLTDAQLLWPVATRSLIEQLQQSSAEGTRVQALDAFFISLPARRRKMKWTQQAIAYAAEKLRSVDTPFSGKDLSRDCNLSERQFERLFREYAGVPARRFFRLQRFAAANLYKHLHPAKSWLSVALENGYYDLNHLSRDFKELGRSSISRFHSYDFREGQVLPHQ